jgi:hypothetical protein
MMNDDSQRAGMVNLGNRKMGQPKYPEKMPNYSPSTAFNYSPAAGYNGGQQHPRRRNDRFKRESPNLTDRVVKQNDIIIRVLKEIRDRLPQPPGSDQKPPESPEIVDAALDSDDSGADDAGQNGVASEPETVQ